MITKPEFKPEVNVPFVVQFPFASADGGVEPRTTTASAHDPNEPRYAWTIQKDGEEFSLWGDSALKAVIDASSPTRSTKLKLAKMQDGQKRSWNGWKCDDSGEWVSVLGARKWLPEAQEALSLPELRDPLTPLGSHVAATVCLKLAKEAFLQVGLALDPMAVVQYATAILEYERRHQVGQ